MALVKADLSNGLRSLSDLKFSNFSGFPSSSVDAAQKWGDFLEIYMNKINPPSTTISEAKNSFIVIYSGMTNNAANGETLLISALNVFVTLVAGGMAPAFVAVPPVFINTDFSVLIQLGFSGADAESCANLFADIVDTKIKTGTATPAAGGPPIFWN